MKKLILTLTTIFLLILFSSFSVFAASVSNNEANNGFCITGGLDFSNEIKSTFDKTRTITGKAQEGDTVTIYVYEKLLEKQEELKEVDKYTVVVGASGYFSQTIDLAVGENIIDINVKDEGNRSSSVSTSIIRKKSEIKNELERAVILPRNRK